MARRVERGVRSISAKIAVKNNSKFRQHLANPSNQNNGAREATPGLNQPSPQEQTPKPYRQEDHRKRGQERGPRPRGRRTPPTNFNNYPNRRQILPSIGFQCNDEHRALVKRLMNMFKHGNGNNNNNVDSTVPTPTAYVNGLIATPFQHIVDNTLHDVSVFKDTPKGFLPNVDLNNENITTYQRCTVINISNTTLDVDTLTALGK